MATQEFETAMKTTPKAVTLGSKANGDDALLGLSFGLRLPRRWSTRRHLSKSGIAMNHSCR